MMDEFTKKMHGLLIQQVKQNPEIGARALFHSMSDFVSNTMDSLKVLATAEIMAEDFKLIEDNIHFFDDKEKEGVAVLKRMVFAMKRFSEDIYRIHTTIESIIEKEKRGF